MMPVQYGIYKGKTPNDKKKPSNLMTSYRPVVAERPVTGSEAHAAKNKLDRTLEASALHPPDYFAYRDELRAAELPLVRRAACTSSLEVYRSVARYGWDESDAYLRKQRDHVQPLCSRLSPAWNYGEWAAGFYSQLRIRDVSADGLTQGHTPEEGYSQGNPFSANGYQAASVLASSALHFPRHIGIPPWRSPATLPINRVSYSDNRAFFEPTVTLVSNVEAECVRATLHTNDVPNMDKLEFSYHTLSTAGLPRPEIVDVPRFKTRTLPIPPLIVGIPIFHTLKPTDKLNDPLRAFRTVYHSIRDKTMAPIPDGSLLCGICPVPLGLCFLRCAGKSRLAPRYAGPYTQSVQHGLRSAPMDVQCLPPPPASRRWCWLPITPPAQPVPPHPDLPGCVGQPQPPVACICSVSADHPCAVFRRPGLAHRPCNRAHTRPHTTLPSPP